MNGQIFEGARTFHTVIQRKLLPRSLSSLRALKIEATTSFSSLLPIQILVPCDCPKKPSGSSLTIASAHVIKCITYVHLVDTRFFVFVILLLVLMKKQEFMSLIMISGVLGIAYLRFWILLVVDTENRSVARQFHGNEALTTQFYSNREEVV